MARLRAEQLADEQELAVEERIARALAMGDLEIEVYLSTHPGATRSEARAAFARVRRLGRRRSALLDEILGLRR